mgnify:CR=1 FL=1
MPDYSKLTQDEFDTYLEEVVGTLTPVQLLAIPGIYEILSEELNNDILALWAQDHPEAEEEDDLDDDKIDDYRCKICGESVDGDVRRDHLESHNPNARGFDWEAVERFFERG